jgi:rhamnose utilization protein RhaD (predicted bifunctional aldolase and dehydrogenase)
MDSRWDDAEAAACKSDLALRCYTSRLLGRDKTLVLHGGGNTSVKVREKDVLGVRRPRRRRSRRSQENHTASCR